MSEIDEARRISFDRAARLYDQARPSYPQAVFAHIRGCTTGHHVLEIGAGTGKATEAYARLGYHVVALEPGPNLAAVLRNKRLPNVHVEETTFEAWRGADGSFDLVTAAQAIHWVDPSCRYVKAAAALHLRGSIAILRTEKQALDPSLQVELEAAYAELMPRTEAPKGVEQVCRDCVGEIDASARFGAVQLARFPWTVRYSIDEYLELLGTYSDHAVLDTERRARLFDAIRRAVARHGDRIEIPYVTLLFVAGRG
jgi:SAM-dependent methyltransferase